MMLQITDKSISACTSSHYQYKFPRIRLSSCEGYGIHSTSSVLGEVWLSKTKRCSI